MLPVIGVWLSLVERLVRDQEVGCSNHLTPTKRTADSEWDLPFFILIYKNKETIMNIVFTSNAPAAIGPYSQAIKVGNLVYTSGQIPIDPATSNVQATTIEGQTDQVCKNLAAVLSAAGTSLDKVVKTTCFLHDMADFAAFNGIYAKYFVNKPARSCVAVKTLPKNVLVEIEVIAEI